MNKQISRMITEREIFSVKSISSNMGGSGIIIIATIMTMPIARIMSLFLSMLLNAPKFIV